MAGLRLPFDYKQDIKYSVRDLSKDVRATIKPCVNYPIYFKKLYPHDKFDIDLATLLQSNPLITPLMGEYVLRASVYWEPDSNLYGWLDNNSKLSTDDLLTRKRHYIPSEMLPTYVGTDSTSINNPCFRGSLADFVGVPPVGTFFSYDGGVLNSGQPEICADRWLTYLDIMRTYYAASQENTIPYIYNAPADPETLNIQHVVRDRIDEYFIWLRQQKDGVAVNAFQDYGDLNLFYQHFTRGGLFCAQYEPDMLRNILYNVDTSKISVSVADNQFTIDTLRFQNKLQRLVDRYDLSGGRFSSWLKTVWGSRSTKRMDIPQFLGTTSVIIDPNTVTATSNTFTEVPDGNDTGSVVGEMSGQINQANYKGRNRNKNFHHYVSVDEPGTLCIIVSLVPKVDYCQGLERELTETSFSDDYKPQFAQLGYQDVPYSDYSLFPAASDGLPQTAAEYTGATARTVVGKQIAWMHLMSDVNRLHGEFATGGEYESYVLRRSFAKIPDDGWQTVGAVQPRLFAKDVTQVLPTYYADPRDWNYPFAYTSPTYDNFFLQVGIRIRAVRPIGKRFMPNLE